jgi:hypothetical protein
MQKIIKYLSIIFLFGLISIDLYGYGKGSKHNEDLILLMFGGDDRYKMMSKKGLENFQYIKDIVYLTTDFSTQYESANRILNTFHSLGIKYIPSVDEIKCPGGGTHQQYSHLGWNHLYVGENQGVWDKRKSLMISVIDAICGFRPEEKIKCDSFAALLYEIHILGDHIGDSPSTRHTRIRLVSEPDYIGQIIPPTSNGPFNNPTLYSYLIYHIQRLFREQSHTKEYKTIISFLVNHKDDFAEEKYESDLESLYTDVVSLATETRDLLSKNLPILLAREGFFQRTFKTL